MNFYFRGIKELISQRDKKQLVSIFKTPKQYIAITKNSFFIYTKEYDDTTYKKAFENVIKNILNNCNYIYDLAFEVITEDYKYEISDIEKHYNGLAINKKIAFNAIKNYSNYEAETSSSYCINDIAHKKMIKFELIDYSPYLNFKGIVYTDIITWYDTFYNKQSEDTLYKNILEIINKLKIEQFRLFSEYLKKDYMNKLFNSE